MEYANRSRVWSREELSRIMSSDREQRMPRGPVISALKPNPGETLADVGAGLGWLSLPLAQQVGSDGKVWAIEPSRDAVEALCQIARAEGLSQLAPAQAFAEESPVPDSSVDGVVWHTVALHMGDRIRAMAETYRMLKRGGRWVVVDWKLIETVAGPPLERRVSAETIAAEARAAGFDLLHAFEPGPVTWGLVWTKR